jgi:outer membrane protein assembly factor BamB
VWRESGIIESFPEEGLPVVWRQKMGSGYSGPAIAKGRLFVMDREAKAFDPKEAPEGNPNFVRVQLPGTERVRCLDEKTGAILWEISYESVYSTAFPYAIGPRCTPTVEGERVYTLGAEGHLKCLSVVSGEELWGLDLRVSHEAKVPHWGFAAHPLIDENRLICMVGGVDSAVVAFDKMTGKELWRAGAAEDPGYCPPVIYSLGGERQLVTWDSLNVNGIDPESGRVFWSIPFPPTYGMSIGMPRREGNRLFVMSFNRVSGMIEVGNDGRSAELAWKGGVKTGVGGVLNTAWIEEGHIYASGNRGEYRCVELATGKRVWDNDLPTRNREGKRGTSWPSTFTVKHEPSGRFFLANDHGELMIASLSPDGYEEISRTFLIEPTHLVGGRYLVWSHPAFANRRVYIRNDKEIVCFDLSLK